MLSGVHTSLRSHSQLDASPGPGAFSRAEGSQRRPHGLECVLLCGEAEAGRFARTGDEEASRRDLHSHLQGDQQEGSPRISTTVHSRRTKTADMKQNNFGLDMVGIFHRGEGQTWQQVVQKGCAASVLGGL